MSSKLVHNNCKTWQVGMYRQLGLSCGQIQEEVNIFDKKNLILENNQNKKRHAKYLV